MRTPEHLQSVFRENKQIVEGGTVTTLYVHAHLTMIERPTLGHRLFLLITMAGEIHDEKLQDEAGDRLHASFEDTMLVDAVAVSRVPRICVQASERWFEEGPAQMAALLDEAQQAAEAADVSKIEIHPLDPETDRLVWALAEQISKLPTRDQIYSTIVALSALLGEQTPETIQRVFDGTRELVARYQASPGFKKAQRKARN